MSQTVQISDINEFMTRHVAEVFGTMLSLKAALVPDAEVPQFGERVTGSVGFAGELVTGAVYLHLSLPLANQATTAMLGMAPQEVPGDTEVNDVAGEITNILTGGMKSWICDAGVECAVSTPAIIRGTSFNIEPMPDVEREFLVFDCGEDRFVIEIHVKFN